MTKGPYQQLLHTDLSNIGHAAAKTVKSPSRKRFEAHMRENYPGWQPRVKLCAYPVHNRLTLKEKIMLTRIFNFKLAALARLADLSVTSCYQLTYEEYLDSLR